MGKKRIITQTAEEVLKEQEILDEALKKTQTKTTSKKQAFPAGRIYIHSSYNNIIMTATDDKGNVLAWTSAGHLQFKGPKKGTPYAAARVAEALVQKIKKLNIPEFSVFIKGLGSGREAALRALLTQGLNVVSIKDITPVPHGGCRPPKVRRV